MLGTYHRLNVHVLASNREVIRATLAAFRPESRRDPKARDGRKIVYRLMLDHHRDAAELFRAFRF